MKRLNDGRLLHSESYGFFKRISGKNFSLLHSKIPSLLYCPPSPIEHSLPFYQPIAFMMTPCPFYCVLAEESTSLGIAPSTIRHRE